MNAVSMRPIDWAMAAVLSIALHVGVAGFYWPQPEDLAQVARRAGGMTIVNGGLVNSAASSGAESVTPPQVQPTQAETVDAVTPQAVSPAPSVPAAAEAAKAADASPVAAVTAARPDALRGNTPASAKPVAPVTVEPVEQAPAKRKAPVEKRRAPASSKSDTAGSQSRAQQRAAQAGSGGRERTADGRAAESGYASKVVARIQRAKRCTSALRSARASGTARIRFTLNRAGRVTAAGVARGSGSRVVDREALSLVRRAGPYPAFPSAIRKSSLSYTVPITYRGC
ncbi:MAG: energy transducer TonB [Rhodobiaceae bacterium]|nr:energy transducer TonB [Rhodobiaceae bacterium]